jgi:hypothetical protein
VTGPGGGPSGPRRLDITGGKGLGDALRSGGEHAARLAQKSMDALLRGHLERDAEEVRAHVAFMQRRLPAADQMAIRAEFGGRLLDPEYDPEPDGEPADGT